jgi:hypothetical protein
MQWQAALSYLATGEQKGCLPVPSSKMHPKSKAMRVSMACSGASFET